MADINDVYAWMTSDGSKVNLALTTSPFDDGTRMFGPTVLYAFHATSRPLFGMPGMESKIICKFASDAAGECWVVDPSGKVVDYVTGDLSAGTGKLSASGKFRVFAGRRSDPFFFNLGGFKSAVAAAEAACGGTCPPGNGLGTDAAGCLTALPPANAAGLRALISSPPATAVGPCAAGSSDCFGTRNVMAIVVQVDKTELLAGTDKLVTVWASTHAGQ